MAVAANCCPEISAAKDTLALPMLAQTLMDLTMMVRRCSNGALSDLVTEIDSKLCSFASPLFVPCEVGDWDASISCQFGDDPVGLKTLRLVVLVM